MSVEGFRLGDREDSRKNHPTAAAAQRCQTASQPLHPSQRPAVAAKQPQQPHVGSCRRRLAPAWLIDYNRLQYDFSRRRGFVSGLYRFPCHLFLNP